MGQFVLAHAEARRKASNWIKGRSPESFIAGGEHCRVSGKRNPRSPRPNPSRVSGETTKPRQMPAPPLGPHLTFATQSPPSPRARPLAAYGVSPLTRLVDRLALPGAMLAADAASLAPVYKTLATNAAGKRSRPISIANHAGVQPGRARLSPRHAKMGQLVLAHAETRRRGEYRKGL